MDVTERKTREETIREQEAELRQILDLTPQLIAVYGANRERLYINRIALDYLGLSLEEWRQTREWGAFVHPDDRARERDYFDRALSTGSAYELELRLCKADGSYRWFLARSNPFRDDKGRIRRWYVSCTKYWQGEKCKGTHPLFVDSAIYLRVQALFETLNRSKQPKHDFPFSGLATCALCGCALTAEIKKGKYIYY